MSYGVANNSTEHNCTYVLKDQRGRLYDVYMKKRETKLLGKCRAQEAEKNAGMIATMESLASASLMKINKNKAMESTNSYSEQLNSIMSTPNGNSAVTPCSSKKTPSTRKENKIPSTRTNNDLSKAPLQRSIARSNSIGGSMSLAKKDLKDRRLRSLRMNSASLGEAKDFMFLSLDSYTLEPSNHTDRLSSGAPNQSHGRRNDVGLSTSKRRNFSASHAFVSGEYESDIMKHFLDGKAIRERKKWGSIVSPFVAMDADVSHLIMVERNKV